jgi:hypothetical protein
VTSVDKRVPFRNTLNLQTRHRIDTNKSKNLTSEGVKIRLNVGGGGFVIPLGSAYFYFPRLCKDLWIQVFKNIILPVVLCVCVCARACVCEVLGVSH